MRRGDQFVRTDNAGSTMTRITLPPRDREEPGICIPDTPSQIITVAAVILALFSLLLVATPNV
jgi:hypothetical protein